MPKSSHVIFRLFVAWNIHTVVFLPILFFSCNCFSDDACVVFIVSGNCNLSSSAFLMQSSSLCIDASTLSSMLAYPLPPSFFSWQSLCHLWDIRSYAWSSVFLFCDPFVEVPPPTTLRMLTFILQVDSLDVYTFVEISALLFSSNFLVFLRYSFYFFFLSSSLVW